jgi:Zn-dependent protease with chaperone function/Tfp pilus assembly protein PilE
MQGKVIMTSLVYPNERPLGVITLVLGLLVWLLIIIGTLGIALAYVLLFFIGYVFVQSGFIAWIKGTAVKLSAEQHPDLYQRFEHCCRKLEMKELPAIYILEGGGMLNAFATRFFGRNFVVLLSDVVDALKDDSEGVNFYIGHELGHIRMGHLTGKLWRLPVLWLPLLGAAYMRAQEYTCDLHGRACCANPLAASHALMALAAGAERWKTSNLANYARQAEENSGFWGSFHELISAYPWLTKRVAHVQDPAAPLPARNPLAYVLALFFPNGGRMGSFMGLMMWMFIIGLLAAIAIPTYQDYTHHAAFNTAWTLAEPVREGLAAYYEREEDVPESLEAAGLPSVLSDGTEISLDTETMTIQALTKAGMLYMQPSVAGEGLRWTCSTNMREREKALPKTCRQ